MGVANLNFSPSPMGFPIMTGPKFIFWQKAHWVVNFDRVLYSEVESTYLLYLLPLNSTYYLLPCIHTTTYVLNTGSSLWIGLYCWASRLDRLWKSLDYLLETALPIDMRDSPSGFVALGL